MFYSVDYTPGAYKELRKLDRRTRSLILSWVEKNLVNCTNPRQHGKALSANRAGQWRYRVGNYRLLAEISDTAVTILILSVGHRSGVYDGH